MSYEIFVEGRRPGTGVVTTYMDASTQAGTTVVTPTSWFGRGGRTPHGCEPVYNAQQFSVIGRPARASDTPL